MSIVVLVFHIACLLHVCQCMTCLLDLAVTAMGCRLHARLHKCVVTWCFLCGSQRVDKKSTNWAHLMSRSVYGQRKCTTNTQIASEGHSCRGVSLTASTDIFIHLFLLQSETIYLLQKAHFQIFILVHSGLTFCWVHHEDSKNLYGNVKMCVGVCMGACVRAKHTSLFDGYFWSQSLCVYGGGKIAHSTSLTLDFIAQGTDKRREGECFFFSLSFSLHPPFHSPRPTFCLSPQKAVERK